MAEEGNVKKLTDVVNVCLDGVHLVEELGELVMQKNPKFKPSIAIRQFSNIVQMCLLESAVAAGAFDYKDISLIKVISPKGDVPGLFNARVVDISQGLPELNWKNLGAILDELQIATRKNLLAKMREYTDDMASDFVKWYAPIDKEQSRDYLSELDKVLDEIIEYYAYRVAERDSIARLMCFVGKKAKIGLLLERWRRVLADN